MSNKTLGRVGLGFHAAPSVTQDSFANRDKDAFKEQILNGVDTLLRAVEKVLKTPAADSWPRLCAVQAAQSSQEQTHRMSPARV